MDSSCGLELCFNFSFALWNGELGLPTVFISVQSFGNKRFVQMFPGHPIASSPMSVARVATRVRSHYSLQTGCCCFLKYCFGFSLRKVAVFLTNTARQAEGVASVGGIM